MNDPPLPPPGLGAPAVLDRIAAAARGCGRDPGAVTLVAAAKTVPPDRVLAAGVADVGENRAQELIAKQDALAGYPIRWHFIGRLQRNKVRHLVGRVVLIHSIDSLSLGEVVAARARALGGVQDVLVEVNTSGERNKAGAAPEDAPQLVGALRRLDGIAVRGLMTVPAEAPPDRARPAFRLLDRLADDLGLEHRSMGMSGDFEAAVEEGATIVRVGTAIFGPRPG